MKIAKLKVGFSVCNFHFSFNSQFSMFGSRCPAMRELISEIYHKGLGQQHAGAA